MQRQIEAFINTRRVGCHRIFGSFSLWSLSAFCQILAAVRAHTYSFNLVLNRFRIQINRGTNMLPSPFAPTVILSLNSFDGYGRTETFLSAPTQRSRRDPEFSSKVPLTHASNCRQKANVSTVRTDQSGRGTYRVSLT